VCYNLKVKISNRIWQNQNATWVKEIASKIKVGEILHQEGMAGMTTKKKINLAQSPNALAPKVDSSFWEDKTIDKLIQEQGVTPVKDEEDFTRRFCGGLEDWNDIDEFLKEIHKPWK
jgi:hypothetical protein